MATKGGSKKDKYGAQKIKTEANRIIKRKKHVKKHPNDLQTAKLIEGK